MGRKVGLMGLKEANDTQVYVEATACFPLIVAATFAKDACSEQSEKPDEAKGKDTAE